MRPRAAFGRHLYRVGLVVRPARRVRTGVASRALLRLADGLPPGTATLGDVLDRLGRTGLGLTLLVLALPSFLPIPGLPIGALFGAALIAVAAQMLMGSPRLALPGWLRRRPVPRAAVVGASRWLAPRLMRVEALLRPRLLYWTGRRARAWTAVPILLAAAAILLPIPLGNQVPALGIVGCGLGFLARDGLAVLAGLSIAMLGVAWNAAVVAFGVELAALLF